LKTAGLYVKRSTDLEIQTKLAGFVNSSNPTALVTLPSPPANTTPPVLSFSPQTSPIKPAEGYTVVIGALIRPDAEYGNEIAELAKNPLQINPAAYDRNLHYYFVD